MAKKKTIDITADITQAKATIGELEDFTKAELKKMAKDAEKSSKDISDAYKKMGIRTDASIKASTAAAKANYAAIKNSGTASAREIRDAHNKMTAKVKANNRELSGGASGLSKVYGALKSKMVGISIAIIATGLAIKKAFDFAEAGAKLQVQREAFDNFAKSVGANGDEIIAKLKEVSKGTVSTANLVASAGKAMLLGLAPDKLVDLLEIARAASKITGDSITKSFEDITTGVGRQSRMILDNLGIILRVGDANEAYAASLGKTVDELTEAEKKLAVLNATAEAGQVIIAGVGNDTLTTADKIARMKVGFAEMSDAMKVFAADVFEKIEPSLLVMGKAFAAAWKVILVNVDGALTGMNALKFVILDAAKWVVFIAKGFTFLSDKLGITNDATATLNLMTEDLKKQMDEAERGMTKAGRAAARLEEAEEKLGRTTQRSAVQIGKATDVVTKSKKQLTKEIKEQEKAIDKASKAEIEALKTQTTLQKTLNATIKTALQATKRELADLETRVQNAAEFAQSIKRQFEAADISVSQRGMNELEVQIDNLERAKKHIQDARVAFAAGEIESAQRLNQLAADAISAVIKADPKKLQEAGISPRGLKEAKQEALGMRDAVIDLNDEMEKAARDKVPAVTAKIVELEDELAAGKGTLAGMIQGIKDAKTEAQALKDKLREDTTSTHTTTMKTVQAGSGTAQEDFVGPPLPPGFKTGGHLPGFGGGDKIHILGEAGEYMLNKESVRTLGLDAARAFNNRDIPALIASLTAPVQRLKEGGSVKGPLETLKLDLAIGGKTLSTTASRDPAKKFFKDLKRMNIIHGRGKRAY